MSEQDYKNSVETGNVNYFAEFGKGMLIGLAILLFPLTILFFAITMFGGSFLHITGLNRGQKSNHGN